MNPINIISYSNTKPLPKTNQLVWWVLSFIETLLMARLFLNIFGVNGTNGLVNLIYSITNYILYPINIFLGSRTTVENVSEWTTILAIVAYLLLAIGLAKVIEIRRLPRSRIERARALSRKKYSH